MSTFIGDFQCKADAKCRIVLPSAFKRVLDEMGDSALVVRKDIFEKCLTIYPRSEWERQMDDLRSKINPYNREQARFLREFQKNTAELSLDNFGRMLVPKRLLTMVEAEKEITLLGVDKHMELWDTASYESEALGGEELASLAEKLLGE